MANSSQLFDAAREAGIQRIVHVSITHPSVDAPFPYFRGKALVEGALVRTGVPHAILRPAILFGGDGVLLNNVAWLLRHLPVFAVGGTGGYRVRGIHVDDLARLCVDKAGERTNSVTDAVGPERPTFFELVSSIRSAVGSRSPILPLPAHLLPLVSKVLGVFLHDVLLTSDEYRAMAAGLADTDGPGHRDHGPVHVAGRPRRPARAPLRQRPPSSLLIGSSGVSLTADGPESASAVRDDTLS